MKLVRPLHTIVRCILLLCSRPFWASPGHGKILLYNTPIWTTARGVVPSFIQRWTHLVLQLSWRLYLIQTSTQLLSSCRSETKIYTPPTYQDLDHLHILLVVTVSFAGSVKYSIRNQANTIYFFRSYRVPPST